MPFLKYGPPGILDLFRQSWGIGWVISRYIQPNVPHLVGMQYLMATNKRIEPDSRQQDLSAEWTT